MVFGFVHIKHANCLPDTAFRMGVDSGEKRSAAGDQDGRYLEGDTPVYRHSNICFNSGDGISSIGIVVTINNDVTHFEVSLERYA